MKEQSGRACAREDRKEDCNEGTNGVKKCDEEKKLKGPSTPTSTFDRSMTGKFQYSVSRFYGATIY